MRPNKKRGYYDEAPSSDPVDEAEAAFANISIAYPLISDWLQGLVDDPVRGRDNQDYTSYLVAFRENGILRLDDITRFSPNDLCDMTGMNRGTAARLMDWAKCDKILMDKRGEKKRIRMSYIGYLTGITVNEVCRILIQSRVACTIESLLFHYLKP